MYQFNNVARVKLVQRNDLKSNKYRLVCAFNVTDTFINASGTESFKFPQQKKCNYVSGDFHISNLDREIARAKSCLNSLNTFLKNMRVMIAFTLLCMLMNSCAFK